MTNETLSPEAQAAIDTTTAESQKQQEAADAQAEIDAQAAKDADDAAVAEKAAAQQAGQDTPNAAPPTGATGMSGTPEAPAPTVGGPVPLTPYEINSHPCDEGAKGLFHRMAAELEHLRAVVAKLL